jgi:hypothetical protein
MPQRDTVTNPVTPGVITSPMYRVRGQTSNWSYPHEVAVPESTKRLSNINISERAVAETRDGWSKYNSASTSAAITGVVQVPYSTGKHIVVNTALKIYDDDGTTRRDVTGSVSLSGASADSFYRYVLLKDALYASDGVNPIWVKDNDFDASPNVATAISYSTNGITLQGAKDIAAHQGILVAANVKEGGSWYPTRLRWCGVDTNDYAINPAYWPDRNRYEVYQGGPAIVGIADNYTSLLVFKEDGVYPGKIDGDLGFLEFRLDEQRVQRGFSPLAKNSIVSRPEFVFCVAREGAVVIRPDLSFEVVTSSVQNEWRKLSQSRLQHAVSWVREKDHQVRTLLSSSGTGHNIIFVWDYQTGDSWFDYPAKNIGFATEVELSDIDYDFIGATDGYLYKGNDADEATDDGGAYNWEIEMQDNDLGQPGRAKHIVRFRTFYEWKSGNTSSGLTLFLDRGAQSSRSTTIKFENLFGSWNDNVTFWDDGTKYMGSNAVEDIFFVNRVAETISPRWTGTQPAKIVGYQVEYELME